jgi:predicted deacetylase
MRLGQRVIISLHDVMPETFRRMEEIIKYLRDHRIPPIALLVVPGRAWKPQQIKRLHKLADVGYELVAHGWRHHTDHWGGPWHRLHGAVFSRRVAEHLTLDSAGIRELMCRSHAWFADHQLPSPCLYVPPAWALGPIRREDLARTPFRRVEGLRGLLNPRTGEWQRLPMIGFDAASRWRALAIRVWNTRSSAQAHRRSLPLRLSLHPEDFHRCLAAHVRETLEATYLYSSYRECIEPD